jgi:hypothetical protein
MSDAATRFHEAWLGMVQPSEGLVVSVPTLVDAQCMERQPPQAQQDFLDLTPPVDANDPDSPRTIANLGALFERLLKLPSKYFDQRGDRQGDGNDGIPEEVSLYVPEGGQTIRPTMALRHLHPQENEDASNYLMLVWDLPDGLALDRNETVTGSWEYPPSLKFDRLLRHCRVPIGLLTNRRVVRLLYAPHGESSGSIDFRVDDMATVGGRPVLDAFVMLLSGKRFFAVHQEHQLPAILAESRKRQANVTNELAEQVFLALETLLQGFEAASERDGRRRLDDAARRDDDHLYGGLLTVLLRLVFILYAEDRGLLPIGHKFYAGHLSVLGLFDELQKDTGAFPDSMDRRFGAWGRLISLFRVVYLGVRHGDLQMPPRRGQLFDPNGYPFLEGWGPGGSAPIKLYDDRAAVRLPSVDDGTVFRVLEKLIIFQSQRLSYRTLDVEQIGSVYEALMGYHVVRVFSPAVCIRGSRCWVEAQDVLDNKGPRLAKWLQETTGLAKAQATKLAKQLKDATTADQVLNILDTYRVKGTERAQPDRLVIQPGAERRRTSSHYTPRSLSEPIVRRTLEPLLATMGEKPKSERILSLKICDPAMGSGAFLVEACRYLADQVVAAWTREGKMNVIASAHEDVVNHARRLVAQRCLYGVDKNPFAAHLAKLSLWLMTMAENLPFTFLDHALRCGDSLVGLDFRQIRSFHWKPEAQQMLCTQALDDALAEAIDLRQEILELAESDDPADHREKEKLLVDAEDATSRVRLIGDLVVGAFFAGKNDKERKKELARRLELVNAWLESDRAPTDELLGLQNEIHERLPVFHWMLEYPEVFHAERPDPLDNDNVNRAAFIDGVIGNPPFLGGKRISTEHGDGYADWLRQMHDSGKNGDLSAHFFRRADFILGKHGTIGLIATNTISQGDTQAAGLQALSRGGHQIYNATRSMPWPGEAAVAVSVVHSAKGKVQPLVFKLDGATVGAINSRLRPKPERPNPQALAANANCSFVGSYVLGMGFTLTPEGRDEIVERDPRNADRIFPYLGGEEVNTSPSQSYYRYVINFEQMDLNEAGLWPDLLEIIRTKVKPERDRVRRDAHRKYWWHYADKRPALYEAISSLDRCLVTARVTKHLCISFQPTGRIYAETTAVFALSQHAALAVLQSRIHRPWAWLLSSSMKTDLRYAASDCFGTFPFPQPDPRTEIPALEAIGERLYEARAKYMLDTQQGLTKTYNHLKDPTCTDASIVELRRLHEEMDRAVLAEYGWDVEVPPYTSPVTEDEKRRLEAFEDEIIDRLFVLNAERAEQERVLGLGSKKGKKASKSKKGVHGGQKGLFG